MANLSIFLCVFLAIAIACCCGQSALASHDHTGKKKPRDGDRDWSPKHSPPSHKAPKAPKVRSPPLFEDESPPPPHHAPKAPKAPKVRSPPPFEDESPLPPHHAPKPPKAPKAPKAPKVRSPPPAKAPPPPSVTLPRSPPPPSSSPLTGKEFNVKNYGAVGDGKHDDAQVDGTLHAIPRSAWLSKFSSEKSWLLFTKVTDFTLTGGTFNGNGQDWWAHSCKKDKSQAVRFEDSKNIKVEGITITNSPQIHITFSDSQAIQATDVVINSPESSPNTDGIHVSGSTNVVVRDADISAGDDCVSIVSGSSNIQVLGGRCGPGHGISIGSLGKGGSYATVSNVQVSGVKIDAATNGVRIKTWQGGKGYVSNVIFENISMDNVKNPIIIDQNYCDGGCGKKRGSSLTIQGVTYSNIVGTSASPDGINLHCSSSGACTNIHFSNVKLTLGSSGKAAGAVCENVQGYTSDCRSSS
ncbi:polygalacturonase ADPG2 [Selaginella moellendorffii]|uniref:polygalacturonase ADPG2 n=1 Tax=Selaginella moellendorffii TaxID=88036 RepID=UPI000D1CBF8A|nr:polygalacturonase ADPG2 [Selaginella moellendorffii]|eukprot:XP_024530862.1 polygalacturonase ADPG2 [Selaginella moellendorffii]